MLTAVEVTVMARPGTVMVTRRSRRTVERELLGLSALAATLDPTCEGWVVLHAELDTLLAEWQATEGP